MGTTGNDAVFLLHNTHVEGDAISAAKGSVGLIDMIDR